LGSLVQRIGNQQALLNQFTVYQQAENIYQPEVDQYNTFHFSTFFYQPISTVLLALGSGLVDSICKLVISIMPFCLGVAKALAILMSVIGVWMLLWPGRFMLAMQWMIGPIAFVGLWNIFFNIWSQIEGSLSAIASVVGGSPHGSWSAGRIMSLALSLGYLGLPTLARHILWGSAHAVLQHGGDQVPHTLQQGKMTAGYWGKSSYQWLRHSPAARRVMQRMYSTVGLGTLKRRVSSRMGKKSASGGATNATATGAPATNATTASVAPASKPKTTRRKKTNPASAPTTHEPGGPSTTSESKSADRSDA